MVKIVSGLTCCQDAHKSDISDVSDSAYTKSSVDSGNTSCQVDIPGVVAKVEYQMKDKTYKRSNR